ncbi:MAG: HU family DNA-binding protein [Deltaproteobacteria bacterium]|nr:HU family DNA-binding protein [Deltaproteobacteria bacterium]
MTKTDLISAMAKETRLTRADSERALNAFLAIAKATIKKDGRFPLAGFGTFVVVNRKARTGRNPRTGQPIQIKASKAVRFRPGKELIQSIA